MKSTKGMYEVAKAQAFANDILVYEDREKSVTYVGYLLPRKSLDKLFRMEGFKREPTIQQYIKSWEDFGWIKIVGQHVFFYPSSKDVEALAHLLEVKEDASRDPDRMDHLFLTGALA